MKHRKLMAMLLSLVIALTFMPAVAFADDEAAEGTEPAAATELQGETAEQPEALGAQGAATEEENGIKIQDDQDDKYLKVGDITISDPDTESESRTGWEYTPGNHTLTLSGCSDVDISYYGFDLTITLTKNNTVGKIVNKPKDAGGPQNDALTINGSGTLNVTDSGGIEAKKIIINSGTVDVETGGIAASEEVKISGGVVAMTGDKGINAGAVTISGGTINLDTYYQCINANAVTISGGTIYARSASVAAAIGSTSNVTISGGNLEVISDFSAGIGAVQNITISGGNVKSTGVYNALSSRSTIIISGDKTRVEAISKDQSEGMAIYAQEDIDIRDPLRIKVPENGEVKHFRDYICTIVKPGEEKVATHVVIEPKRETYDILIATAKANGKESIDLSWNKLDGVDGYDVFFSRCNTKKQKYTCEYAGSTDGSATAWSKADLKRRTPYKMYVMAYVMSGGSKTYVAKSPTVHAYTGGGNGRYTNPKSVKVKKSKVTVKKNKTYKIKASVRKLRKGKRLINGSHARKLRYLSSNTSVATVTKYGKIKGVAPGTCDVYVLAVNGSYKKVAVTVK